MEKISDVKSFGGRQIRCRHHSIFNNCEMQFSVYLPPQATEKRVPVLYWLSGLASTDEDFANNSGAQRFASQHGIALVAPDTSPRGEGVPDDEDGASDFGLGAGFYVKATEKPWSKHYNMYEYVVTELPALINAHFNVDVVKRSISGIEMGGHGALTIALNNPEKYMSVSAFSPICTPINCAWGQKAFSQYIGLNVEQWVQYDTCALIPVVKPKFELLIDQGLSDVHLLEQLKPGLLKEVCSKHNYPLQLRLREGYDNSYHFVASFIDEHIAYHARHLLSA